MILFRLIMPKTAYVKAAKNILMHDFISDEIGKIMALFNTYHETLARQYQKSESGGVRLLLKLACKNIALYRSLIHCHVDEEKALFILENVQCEFTKNFASFIHGLSGLVCRDVQRRLEWVDKFLWKFLFTRPFRRLSYSVEENSIAFKVVRCPIADYFKAHTHSELCKSAFCNLYYHWAELGGVTLDRSGTLASGASCCSFKFQIYTEKIQ